MEIFGSTNSMILKLKNFKFYILKLFSILKCIILHIWYHIQKEQRFKISASNAVLGHGVSGMKKRRNKFFPRARKKNKETIPNYIIKNRFTHLFSFPGPEKKSKEKNSLLHYKNKSCDKNNFFPAPKKIFIFTYSIWS